MTPRTSSPGDHARATRPCVSLLFAGIHIDPCEHSQRCRPKALGVFRRPQHPGTRANWGPSTIIPNEQATPGKFACTEMVVGADADPLSGRTRVGFVVSERLDRGRGATCPARHSDAIR